MLPLPRPGQTCEPDRGFAAPSPLTPAPSPLPFPSPPADVSQAEAYAHTLMAFKKAFPAFAPNDVYLTGESYFGQYGPNIANYILTHAPFNTSVGLKGIAAGNACWGGSATHVQCNGPNSEQNDVDMYFGKGLVSEWR